MAFPELRDNSFRNARTDLCRHLVNINRSQEIKRALINGDVDAVVMNGFNADDLADRLGDDAVKLSVQSSQWMYGILICRDDWLEKNPEAATQLLKSLALAEDYVSAHPTEAKAIIQKHLNCTDAYMAVAWQNNYYSLSLDQSLIAAMEDEARWMIKNNLTAEKTVPDFTDYIYTQGLREVKPDSVNI